MSALREALEALVNHWAVGGNGIDAASCDLVSACSAELLQVLDKHPETAGDEPAKVIVVEREDHPARLFAATGWEVLPAGTDAGDLVLAADGDEWVAQISARHWDAVCKAEAILPADLYERQGRKLAIALDALRDVRHTGSAAHDKAQAALDRIAELDL